MRDATCESYEPDLTAFRQGELDEERRAEVGAHLADCAACASALREIEGVFTLAATVEDVLPSPALRRALERRLAPAPAAETFDAGIFAGLRDAAAFLLHRLRTSRRFRLATVSVGAHVVLLLLVSLVVIPQVVEEPPGILRPGIDRPLAPVEDARLPDPASHPAPAPLPDFDDVSPEIVERHPFAGTSSDPDLPDVRTYLPPMEHPVVQPLAGIFSVTIDADVKRRRLSACLKDPEAALASVERALSWLADRQADDGSFPASRRAPEYATGVTAAVVLAFAADGHSETRGDPGFRETVTRALDRLLADQHDSGVDQGLIGPARGHFAYNHALATMALVEMYVLDYRRVPAERTLELKRALRLAVDYIVRAQVDSGAWPYGGPPDARQADSSVAIYMGMALSAARSARIPVPERTLGGLTGWLRSVTDEQGVVGYLVPGDRSGEPGTLTAGALFVEELLGIAAPVRDRQAALVERQVRDPNATKHNGLLRFYAAMAFRARGNPVIERFVPEMLALQSPEGAWDAESDEWAVFGGDVFLTALNVLTVTSTFRLAG